MSEHASYDVIVFEGKDLPEQYRGLVHAQWLHSQRFGSPWFKLIDSKVYYKEYDVVIKRILNEPDAVVRIAVLSDDHDVALGFSVIRSQVLDYVFVQKDHRRLGIAKKLVPPEVKVMSHLTRTSKLIWRDNEKYRHFKFIPFLRRENVQ